jgi:hypothetical protein
MGHQRVTSRRPAQQENIDKAPAIAQQFAVEAVPTLLVLNDYEVLGRQPALIPLPHCGIAGQGAHAHLAGTPIVKAMEPGANWRWC